MRIYGHFLQCKLVGSASITTSAKSTGWTCRPTDHSASDHAHRWTDPVADHLCKTEITPNDLRLTARDRHVTGPSGVHELCCPMYRPTVAQMDRQGLNLRPIFSARCSYIAYHMSCLWSPLAVMMVDCSHTVQQKLEMGPWQDRSWLHAGESRPGSSYPVIWSSTSTAVTYFHIACVRQLACRAFSASAGAACYCLVRKNV